MAPFFQVAKQTAGPAVVLSFAIAGDISDHGLFFLFNQIFLDILIFAGDK